jgi:NADH:ubiquinone oxidoreductase subunit E
MRFIVTQDKGAVEIVVCLGSSCFARGNANNLELINKYVQSHGLGATVRITGRLCQDECMQGPNLSIGGEIHHGVTTAKLYELLEQLGSESRSDHATL